MEASPHSPSPLPHSHSVRVDSSGRIVVPVDLRERCQILPGHQVVLEEAQGHLIVRTYEQVLNELQEYCADVEPSEVLLSDQLIQERRLAAAREFADLVEPAGSHD